MSVARLVCLLALLLAVSCEREPACPPQLAQADSLLEQGRYAQADSLLELSPSSHEAESWRMYRQLLSMGLLFMRDQLVPRHLSAADSLCRYYMDNGTREQYAKALLCKGSICRTKKDFPLALQCFIEAESISKACHATTLQGLSCKMLGDTYFDQQMYDECKPFYRRYALLAEQAKDTLRLAYAATRMGRVYTIENKADSALQAYSAAIELAKDLPQAENIVPVAVYCLCDIYIQTEQFEKAETVMPHDSLNMGNWAYWHYGKQHTDSAIWYFEKILDRQSLFGKSEVLRILSELYEKKGDNAQAFAFSKRITAVEDSMRAASLREETIKTRAKYDIGKMTNEQTRSSVWAHSLTMLSLLLVIVVAVLVFTLVLRRRKTRSPVEEQYSADECGSEQNELLGSEIFQTIMKHAGTDHFHLSNEQWEMLAKTLDLAYNNFTSRLLQLAPLTEYDLHICYLTKLGKLSATNMAKMLSITRQAVGEQRKRIFKKLTGKR